MVIFFYAIYKITHLLNDSLHSSRYAEQFLHCEHRAVLSIFPQIGHMFVSSIVNVLCVVIIHHGYPFRGCGLQLTKKKDYAAAALLFASFVHNSKCPCSSFRIDLTVVPNFLFFTSFAIEASTS